MNKSAFSERQTKVAEYVAAGYSNRDIAKELGLSEQIVKNVVHSLFDKLGVWNRVELANHLLPPSSEGDVELTMERIERERVTELRRRAILDTAADRVFDEITSLAANAFDVPIALVALVDSDRVWFKSSIGLQIAQVEREISICHHAIQQSSVFIVNDALGDQRFMCSPLVASDPKVRFYAAAPILTDDGYALGVVCVVDRVPRQCTQAQREILVSLARVALEQIEVRAQLRRPRRAKIQMHSLNTAAASCGSAIKTKVS